MFKTIAALTLSVLLIAACDSTDSDNPRTVRFQIEVMEEMGVVANGEITFEEPAPGSASLGVISLSTPSGEPLDPMTTTSAELAASMTTDGAIQLYISDPLVSDSGLRFDGDYAASGFSGTWGTITFIGYEEKGTFTATAEAN